jgi:hypothetical protein
MLRQICVKTWKELQLAGNAFDFVNPILLLPHSVGAVQTDRSGPRQTGVTESSNHSYLAIIVTAPIYAKVDTNYPR